MYSIENGFKISSRLLLAVLLMFLKMNLVNNITQMYIK